MNDPTEAFFAGLAAGRYEPLLKSSTGTIRFDILDESRTVSRFVTVRRGRIKITETGGEPDCVVTVERDLLNRIVTGEANAMAAALRGTIRIQGDPSLLMRIQRLFAMAPSPETVARERRAS